MIRPEDIPDLDVREWFLQTKAPARRWLVPVLRGYLRGPEYLTWVKKVLRQEEQIVFWPVVNETKELAESQGFTDVGSLESLVKKHNINAVFSHATFCREGYPLRKALLHPDMFRKVLAVWHEGGFIRSATGQNKCEQLDWMGWNALSSLAFINLDEIPPLNERQEDMIHEFMNIFASTKTNNAKTVIQSEEQLRDTFKIPDNKCVVVVPLQVHNDSVLVHFTPETFRDQTFYFRFAESQEDCFFIFSEHPKQTDTAPHLLLPPEINNYRYVGKDYDTYSLCRSANMVLVSNSTSGFESLFWTPVVRTGRSSYYHNQVSYSFEEFRPWLPLKDHKNISKFLHYAVNNFHFTQGVNVNSHKEWFDFLWTFRMSSEKLIDRQNRMIESYPNLPCH